MRRAWLLVVVAGGTLAVSGSARAVTYSSYPSASWGVSNTSLGFASSAAVEDFEDTILVAGLSYEYVGTPSSPAPMTTLPNTFAPASDPYGKAFAQGAWDGTHALLNTADNLSHDYANRMSWGGVRFFFADGVARVGFSLTDLEQTFNTLTVNGIEAGSVGQIPGTENLEIGSSRRNGYVVISAGPGELIYDVEINNQFNGDGWAIDHLLIERQPALSAVVFLGDDLANSVYRYRVTPGGPAVLEATIPVQSANAFAFRDGEMFVGDFAGGGINRLLSPLNTPRANGRIGDVGLAFPEQMAVVGGELWVLNSDLAGSQTPASLVRLGFDAQGKASVVGTITAGLTGANRGLLWNAQTSELFVSQCCGARTIQHYQIGGADAGTGDAGAGGLGVTMLQPISIAGTTVSLHGMAYAPWGELCVVSTEGAVYRLTYTDNVFVQNSPPIRSNDFSFPVGIGFTPWGEMLVSNQANGTVARITFDASHKPIPGGTFQTPSTASTRLSWLAVVPLAAGCAPPTAPACQPPKPDAGSGGDAAADGGADAGAPTDAGSDARDAAGSSDARDAAADRAPDAGRPGSGGGCGCRMSGTSGSGAAGVLALSMLAALVRRRGRRSR